MWPIPLQHLDQICLLAELSAEDLDPELCNLLWLPRKRSLLYGTKSGAIYCRTGASSKDTLITELVYEQPIAIHFLRLRSSMQLNAMVVLGQEGTVQLLTVSDQKISRHEFYVPGPVLASAVIKNNEALLTSLKERGQLYFIEFLSGAISDFSLQIGCLDLLDQVKQIYSKKTSDEFVLELIQKDYTLVTARTNLRKSKRNVNQSPEDVERAIQDVLEELEQQENQRKEIDAYTEKLNSRLTSVNRTIYALQRIKSQKKKLQEGEQSPFQCDIQPLVIPPSSRYLAGGASCALRIRVHTSIDLDWDKWYLHAELSNKRTLLQEKISSESKASDSVDGLTLLMPLVGLTDDYIWERDIPVDIERLCLPIHVNLHVSTCVDLNVPSGTTLDLTEATPFMFHLSDATLDDLHFITPCAGFVLKLLEKDGIQETTAQLLGEYNRRRLLDNTNRYPLARLEKSDQCLWHLEETELKLQVLVKPETTADETYGRIIATFLKEGRTQEEMQQIMQDQERAVFALAGYPESPVIVSLSKDLKSSSSEMISATLTLQCAHPVLHLKVEAALLARLQYLFEIVEGNHRNNKVSASSSPPFSRSLSLIKQDQINSGTGSTITNAEKGWSN
ncbi:hypothetical protein BJV82DRAFT_291185 [Fennellomyces sp. T-0311]|nr:hypothetical protein BJV82DRAFT_291185 [Fennellomyces sp. T-0311]